MDRKLNYSFPRISNTLLYFRIMKTIHSILRYILTEQQEKALHDVWIVNGVGGEGQNIEKALLAIIELLPWYDNNKAESLLNDIRKLAIRHDVEYVFKLWFYLANFRFAKWLFHLLHWSNWKRLAVAITAFIILNRWWKKFYNKR